jgi:hypothetical protein
MAAALRRRPIGHGKNLETAGMVYVDLLHHVDRLLSGDVGEAVHRLDIRAGAITEGDTA